jgi:quercetin dioxygenase-like cupin family protein
MEVDGDEKIIKQGDAVRINPGVKHRFSGLEDSTIIEISTHHEDSDSYREEGQLSGDVPKKIMEKYM